RWCIHLHQVQENASMAVSATTPTTPTALRHPLSISLLAGNSLLIGVVTGIPQLYYILFAINRDIFPVGLNANFLGALRYTYILGGHQGGYLQVASVCSLAPSKTASCSPRCTLPPAWACYVCAPGSIPAASSPAPRASTSSSALSWDRSNVTRLFSSALPSPPCPISLTTCGSSRHSSSAGGRSSRSARP